MIQGVLPAFSGLLSVKIRAVEPFFHDLDIVVAKIPPEQIIDLMPCGAGLIFGKQGGGFADGIVAACQDPAVNRQQVRKRLDNARSSGAKKVSVPSFAFAAQYLMASAEWVAISSVGERALLLLDLLIFSPFLARTKPLIITSFQGSFPVW